ncbi:hypothetical protein GCM10020255_083550 [Rhodococcus baikonurensis]
MSRPGAPWARSRYRDKPAKMSRAVAREQRYREPMIHAKIYVQETVSGSFGSTPRPHHRSPSSTPRRLRRKPDYHGGFRTEFAGVALAEDYEQSRSGASP